MMKQHLNICNLYLLLWLVYCLKGFLYSGDTFSLLSYALVMLISFYYFIESYKDYKKQSIIRWFNILVIYFTIYGIINIICFDDFKHFEHTIPTDFYLQNILRSILPFYAFYAFTKKGYINKKWLCYIAIIMIFVNIPRYYIAEQKMIESRIYFTEEVTNNAGYLFSAILPLLCLVNKKPLIQYIGFAICGFFIFSSMKRGCIVVGILSLTFYFYSMLKSVNKKTKVTILILFIVLLIIGYNYLQYLLDNSTYFQFRLEETKEGDTSSRSYLYSKFWNMFWNSDSFISIFFGMGADATLRYGGDYAHNDWLEIAINQGFIGITFFFLFGSRLYNFMKQLKIYPVLYVAFGVCLIQLVLKSLFSMSINDIDFYTACLLGYSVAVVANSKLGTDLNI